MARRSCDEAGCITYVFDGCAKFEQLIDRAASGRAARRLDIEVESFMSDVVNS